MAIDLEAIRRKMEKLGGKRSGVQLWKPTEPGDYRIRALPWPDALTADGTPFVERYFYYIGDNSGILAPKQFGEEDPVAVLIDALFKSGEESDRTIAKKLLPKMRAYLPVIVKGEEDKGVQIYSFNRDAYKRLLSFFINEEIGDFLDPLDGFDLTVTLTDNGRRWKDRTMYDQTIDVSRWPSPLSKWFDGDEDKTEEVLKKLPNVDDLYTNARKTPAEVKEILDKWLAGDEEDTGEGTTRGKKEDAKPEKISEGKGDKSEPDDEKKAPDDEKPKARKRRVKKSDSDDVGEETSQSLDEAFDELMDE